MFIRPICFLGALLVLAHGLSAEVIPSSPFTDHMVLQQGPKTAVFGTAAPGEKVAVTLGGQTQTTTATPDGHWLLHLQNLRAGGPFTLAIAGTNKIELTDVYVGEVWLCSGQSNMDFTVATTPKYSFAGVENQVEEIKNANYPTIRMFSGHWQRTYEPQAAIDGRWKVVTPENVREMSAIGYFFARDLQKELKVPIGILTETYGASTAESWVSREALAAVPEFNAWLDDFDAKAKAFTPEQRKEYAAKLKQWEIDIQKTTDAGRGRLQEPRLRNGRVADPADDQHSPTTMYNGMIAPVLPFTVKGTLWYQGESILNGHQNSYPLVIETLIKDWRMRFQNPDMPFYAVQLAAYNMTKPEVREAQLAILKIPHTGLAVTIDIGDRTGIHPRDKQDVGDRLARIALANTYGQALEYSGPMYDSMTVEGPAIRINFTHAQGSEGALVAKDKGGDFSTTGELHEFTIAGADGKYVPATAKIDKNTLLVSSPDVLHPVAVRYAWSNYPETPNLYNAARLPASPFRTDAK